MAGDDRAEIRRHIAVMKITKDSKKQKAIFQDCKQQLKAMEIKQQQTWAELKSAKEQLKIPDFAAKLSN